MASFEDSYSAHKRTVVGHFYTYFDNVHVMNERLPQAIHYNGEILCALLASDKYL